MDSFRIESLPRPRRLWCLQLPELRTITHRKHSESNDLYFPATGLEFTSPGADSENEDANYYEKTININIKDTTTAQYPAVPSPVLLYVYQNAPKYVSVNPTTFVKFVKLDDIYDNFEYAPPLNIPTYQELQGS